MSVVNAATIYVDSLVASNVSVGGGATTITVTGGQIAITTPNVSANSTVLKLDNTTTPTQNTTINATSLSTGAIKVNNVEYTALAATSPLIDYQVFTSTVAQNFWYKPAWAQANDIVTIMMWGGGGGGGNNSTTSGSGGGGGGACVIVSKLASELNAICNVVVGAGGAVSVAGDNSVFWPNSSFSITAYGGGGSGNNIAGCAGGGGWFAKGFNSAASQAAGANGGGPLGGDQTIRTSTFGGGAGANQTAGSTAGSSVYGGGGAGRSTTEVGGSSIYGGGGGAAQAALGTSIFGGAGGNASISATAPGGGGGANAAGARGEVRVWVTAAVN